MMLWRPALFFSSVSVRASPINIIDLLGTGESSHERSVFRNLWVSAISTSSVLASITTP